MNRDHRFVRTLAARPWASAIASQLFSVCRTQYNIIFLPLRLKCWRTVYFSLGGRICLGRGSVLVWTGSEGYDIFGSQGKELGKKASILFAMGQLLWNWRGSRCCWVATIKQENVSRKDHPGIKRKSDQFRKHFKNETTRQTRNVITQIRLHCTVQAISTCSKPFTHTRIFTKINHTLLVEFLRHPSMFIATVGFDRKWTMTNGAKITLMSLFLHNLNYKYGRDFCMSNARVS